MNDPRDQASWEEEQRWNEQWEAYVDLLDVRLDRRDRHLPLPAVSLKARVIDLFTHRDLEQDEAA